VSTGPVTGRDQHALWRRPIAWLWAKKAWIAALVGALLIATTVYVLWAIKDLPDPSQNVLAAGDVMVLDRNGKLIEDWSPAGHYHVTLQLKEMGAYAPKAVLAARSTRCRLPAPRGSTSRHAGCMRGAARSHSSW